MVGDGNFSFSLALARLLSSNNEAASIILESTSYEDKETLLRVYPDFEKTSNELEALGATLCYKVDVTRLEETLPTSLAPNTKLDCICWNFPCFVISMGQDGQNQEMENNKLLVSCFVSNAKTRLLKPHGEIHTGHKSKPPFNHWKLEQVAVGIMWTTRQ
jgi:hypothetical protein